MCEAFAEHGIDLELIVPNTKAARTFAMREFYGLRCAIRTRRILVRDWYASGTIAFVCASLLFMAKTLTYLYGKWLRGERAVAYTIDMDSFSYALLLLNPFSVVAEMHDVKSSSLLNRLFFWRARFIIATNAEIKTGLMRAFGLASERLIVEPNGVDLQQFAHAPEKDAARRTLGLPADKKIALYMGRFYAWKGLDILAAAARLAPEIEWYVVGGTEEEFSRATGAHAPHNLHIAGEASLSDVPTWLASADVLLVLGTKKNDRSWRGTSPMKVFEYMAAGRPIVASKTPALESIIPTSAAFFYSPDDPESLAEVARRARTAVFDSERYISLVQKHFWSARVSRILKAVSF